MSFKLWLSTSSPLASLAFETEARWLVKESLDLRHTEFVMSSIHSSLHELGLSIRDMNELYVDLGPGSFTGVRFALSLAKAWALSIPQLKIFSLNSFQAMSHLVTPELRAQHPNTDYFLALNAHRQAIYLCPFGRWDEQSLIYLDQLDEWRRRQSQAVMWFGNAVKAYGLEKLCENNDVLWQDGLPHVKGMKECVTQFHMQPATEWRSLQANYLRPSAPEESRHP
ncbi:MAG: tRNA (adenosine(37)-N6)-threonylcarbamoyltransferase complex dimerization subunit type 1 TsaB [Bdellovibrionaceae bacterium]|jgi:tRNA threonylcarbamoyl adenosine modification protein YeaZ|nr:tRNA (adenosine(37)-N6)-threonylcarbamoyltransferase complex dimerization subunit type 1 TsaB [Pseudobdellovibrionaceae bacterium]